MRRSEWSDPGVRRLPGVRPADVGPVGDGVDRRVATLGARPDKADLLAVLAEALGLPSWFGHNWDALADGLADLHRPTTLVLVGVDRLDEATAATLVEVLALAAVRSAGGPAPLSTILLDGEPGPGDDRPGPTGQDTAAAGSGGASDADATSCWLDG